MTPVRGGMVRLDPSRGSTLTLILDGAPDRSGGVGGWESSERALRAPAKWWKQQPDSTLSLPCMLDLHAVGGPALERRLVVLYAMGSAGTEDEPPTIRVSGDIAARDRAATWVLQNVSLGDRTFTSTGELRHQKLTLELEGYQGLDTIEAVAIKRTRQGKGKRRARVIRTRSNDTLRAIAVRQLGSSTEWKRIRTWNPRLKRIDPDAPLRAGIKVTLR